MCVPIYVHTPFQSVVKDRLLTPLSQPKIKNPDQSEYFSWPSAATTANQCAQALTIPVTEQVLLANCLHISSCSKRNEAELFGLIRASAKKREFDNERRESSGVLGTSEREIARWVQGKVVLPIKVRQIDPRTKYLFSWKDCYHANCTLNIKLYDLLVLDFFKCTAIHLLW